MIRIERGFFGLLAAVVFVVGAHGVWCCQEGAPNRGTSGVMWLPMDEQGQLLQAEIDRAQERGVAKRAVVHELLAERLTLHQAAARFQELDATVPPTQLAHWRENCLGDTDEERYCWTVVRYVGTDLLDRPQQARAVRQRLERELPNHLRRRLPMDLRFAQGGP